MIKIHIYLELAEDNTMYINAKDIYLFGIKIYSKFIYHPKTKSELTFRKLPKEVITKH